MASEKKLLGDSGEDSLKKIDGFRTGASSRGYSCCLSQLTKEGCFLPKVKHGPGIQAELSLQMGLKQVQLLCDSVGLDWG